MVSCYGSVCKSQMIYCILRVNTKSFAFINQSLSCYRFRSSIDLMASKLYTFHLPLALVSLYPYVCKNRCILINDENEEEHCHRPLAIDMCDEKRIPFNRLFTLHLCERSREYHRRWRRPRTKHKMNMKWTEERECKKKNYGNDCCCRASHATVLFSLWFIFILFVIKA